MSEQHVQSNKINRKRTLQKQSSFFVIRVLYSLHPEEFKIHHTQEPDTKHKILFL